MIQPFDTMMSFPLHFLPVVRSDSLPNQKEIENARAEAKSHARRMSHRKTTSQTRTCPSTSHQSVLRIQPVHKVRRDSHFCISTRSELLIVKQGWKAISRRREQTLQESYGSVQGIGAETSGCDPFVRFPFPLSYLDQKLFHFCEVGSTSFKPPD
jgi:hypothetical protein